MLKCIIELLLINRTKSWVRFIVKQVGWVTLCVWIIVSLNWWFKVDIGKHRHGWDGMGLVSINTPPPFPLQTDNNTWAVFLC